MTAASRKVAIIDGGGANIASLQFALRRLGVDGELTADPEIVRAASHVILPGVGAARAAMDRLRAAGLLDVIGTLSQPVLGICLGMQLLYARSEEDDTECLGILPGTVQRLVPGPGRPVPHMGWNQVVSVARSRLLTDVPDGSYFYFVHGYAAGTDPSTVAQTEYGEPFSAAIESANFMATQFHPERSGPLGATILSNFLNRY